MYIFPLFLIMIVNTFVCRATSFANSLLYENQICLFCDTKKQMFAACNHENTGERAVKPVTKARRLYSFCQSVGNAHNVYVAFIGIKF